MQTPEPFVDWISIKQRHSLGGLPVVAESRIISTSVELDSVNFETLKSKNLRGSYDTSLIIRCDGKEVSVSGNVGRFGRKDNLFNLSFDDTIEKLNHILAEHEPPLPPFSPGDSYINPSPSKYDVKHDLLECYSGATVSQLHLTTNYSTGSIENTRLVIDHLDKQSVSHIKKGRAGPTTVQFGSKGGRKLIKYYCKPTEMYAHTKGSSARSHLTTDKVYIFSKQNGVIRAEVELHRHALRDLGLRYLGHINMEKLHRVFQHDTEVLNRKRIDTDTFEIIHLPLHLRGTAALYLRGEDVKTFISQATWYRHAKQLREYGIDIAESHNVSAMPIKMEFKKVTLEPLRPPDWYWEYSCG